MGLETVETAPGLICWGLPTVRVVSLGALGLVRVRSFSCRLDAGNTCVPHY